MTQSSFQASALFPIMTYHTWSEVEDPCCTDSRLCAYRRLALYVRNVRNASVYSLRRQRDYCQRPRRHRHSRRQSVRLRQAFEIEFTGLGNRVAGVSFIESHGRFLHCEVVVEYMLLPYTSDTQVYCNATDTSQSVESSKTRDMSVILQTSHRMRSREYLHVHSGTKKRLSRLSSRGKGVFVRRE